MTENETIREAPEEEYREPQKSEYEPDPDKLCEHTYLLMESPTESKIIHCPNLADYRILRFSDTQVLMPDGDASNPRHWKPETFIEYLCSRHMDIKYKYSMPPTPRITFVKIKRP